eukprot:13061846-Alexandrium_andersonii.AAC.1
MAVFLHSATMAAKPAAPNAPLRPALLTGLSSVMSWPASCLRSPSVARRCLTATHLASAKGRMSSPARPNMGRRYARQCS